MLTEEYVLKIVANRKGLCLVARQMAVINKKHQKLFLDLLRDKDIEGSFICEKLSEYGFNIGETYLRLHRRNKCSCPQSSEIK